MSFTRTTEIRHISPADLGKVAQLLNQTFAWKKLMQTVPAELTHPEQLNEGKQKYNFDHMKLIENASFKLNKAPAQIFLEEWVTTGRVRPTLSHLLQLLIKTELFRAADYVAVNLLNEEPPERPKKGPAVKIDIDLPDEDVETDVHERISAMNYPNSSEIINLNNDHILSKEIHNKQMFDRTLSTQTSSSKEDLIQFSAVKSASNNIQVNEDSHRTIESHQSTTTTLNRNTQRPEDTDIHISLRSESALYSAPEAPKSSCFRTDSTSSPSESNYETNDSTDYLPSIESTSTSFDGTYPEVSLLNANYSHPTVKNPPINSYSNNVFPNISLLNVQPDVSMLNVQSSDSTLNVESCDPSTSTNSHDYEEFPNLSALNLPTQQQELELVENIPRLSALFTLAEVSSENVVPKV